MASEKKNYMRKGFCPKSGKMEWMNSMVKTPGAFRCTKCGASHA